MLETYNKLFIDDVQAMEQVYGIEAEKTTCGNGTSWPGSPGNGKLTWTYECI